MSLEDLRNEIDGIDNDLTRLFERRMSLAAQVAQTKRQSGAPVFQHGREEAILQRLSARVNPELAPALRQLYATLFRLSRARQQHLLVDENSPLRHSIAAALRLGAQGFPTSASVACQGIEGAYSHLAARSLFRQPKVVFVRSFDAVFRAVEQRLCRYGVLPIENSTYGSVTQVYDLLKRHDCRIVRSLRLRVEHCLLGNAASIKAIREIYSHEQALGQCADFLAKHPEITVTVCENTAVAARMAAESGRTDAAAISSEECAALYGLRVLLRGIQNEKKNETRFICIAPQTELYPGANRCSVLLSLKHEPGSLAALLQLPAALGINMTKLENRPAPGKDFEFLFYLDLEADAARPETQDFLECMAELSEDFTFLGSYFEEATAGGAAQ
jgi:chorismate mutase/prephenate dehydratase